MVYTSHALLPIAYMTSKVLISTVLSGAGSSGEVPIEQPVAAIEK